MTGRYTRGLRIRTKCVTVEQLVAWFHRFCDETAIFIATQAPRPEGLETAFSVDLASGEPALAGEGIVVATWTNRDNRFKAPGMQIGVRSLTKPSKQVFEQMLIARALTLDAASIPTTEWTDDGTDVRAPTFDDLAAAGAAAVIAVPVVSAASAAQQLAGAKPGAKHTMIGLPAIPMKPAAPRPAVTIALARTETAPKLEPPRAAQPRIGPGSFVVPSKIAPVVPSKITPVAPKKGPVVITTLHATPPAATPVVASAKPGSPATPATASAKPASPATPATASAKPVSPSATPVAASAKPAPTKSTPSLGRGTVAMGSLPSAIAPAAPSAIVPAAASAIAPTAPSAASATALAASAVAQAASASSTAQAATASASGAAAGSASASSPAASPAMAARAVPASGTSTVAATASMSPTTQPLPASVREPSLLARGSNTPLRALTPPATPVVTPKIATGPVSTIAAAAPTPAVDNDVPVPVAAEPVSGRVPRAATQLGSGPVVARMPAVIFDADLDAVDEASLQAIAGLSPEPPTNVDAQPLGAMVELGVAPAVVQDTAPNVSIPPTDVAPAIAEVAAAPTIARVTAAPATSSSMAEARASVAVNGVPIMASVGTLQPTTEPTWDEIAASTEVSRLAPPIEDVPLTKQLGATPMVDAPAALTIYPRRSRSDSMDGDALPLPPAPDVPQATAAVPPASEDAPQPPRRRRGVRIAVASIAFIATAAAATALVLFGPWAITEQPVASVVPEPNVAAIEVAEDPQPPPTMPAGALAQPTEPPLVADNIIVPPDPIVETPVAQPAPAVTPVSTETEPDANTNSEPVANPSADAKPVPTKNAKKPARVKRVAKVAPPRTKIRPKKKAACTDLSCL